VAAAAAWRWSGKGGAAWVSWFKLTARVKANRVANKIGRSCPEKFLPKPHRSQRPVRFKHSQNLAGLLYQPFDGFKPDNGYSKMVTKNPLLWLEGGEFTAILVK